MIYADIIVDISHENLDKSYQYAVPPFLEDKALVGALAVIPFGKGNREINGYIVGLSEKLKCPPDKIKEILKITENAVRIESHLIQLAGWIRENYGATMNDALKTVIPIKNTVRKKEKRYLILKKTKEEAKEFLEECRRLHYTAKARLLEALLDLGAEELDYDMVSVKQSISLSTIRSLEEAGVIEVSTLRVYRNPVSDSPLREEALILNEEQQRAADTILGDYEAGIPKTYLIHGITGSGKTEVYMQVIQRVVDEGKQVIMLIPEIALTFQTVMRFYRRFGSRVSILHSRLSRGERYDQYVRAKNKEVDIMIGPRSALFTPFENLGLIIMDEEHEESYKSEGLPKYHARETAIERAKMAGAFVILGSATPSLESYKKAAEEEYQLITLKNRAGEGALPHVWTVDLREELKQKNKSMFSRKLKTLMEERLKRKEQIILFINRRGYAGFVSCRSCGHVMKCPHCEVSLTYHSNGRLLCHYCGYGVDSPKKCPECTSPYIAAFGTGTQKVEELVKKEFPGARVLRMDSDTTAGKDGHKKILSVFANEEADILIGTQMIVKGHDFPGVTLVGIVAADLSLYAGDFRAAEKTFQLLTQAAGRAGRGEKAGEVVIQTYHPDHYSIICAAAQDYEEFYHQEMLYRSLLSYPPAGHMMAVLVSSIREQSAKETVLALYRAITARDYAPDLKIIGPAKAGISKINDIYRRVLYFKCGDYDKLKEVKNTLEAVIDTSVEVKQSNVQFDFDPLKNY